MPDETLRNAAADSAGSNLEGAWYAVHNGDTSADQVSNERLQPVYDPAATGAAALAAPLVFTGTPGASATHLGVWSASTAGTFRFAVPLTGSLTFDTAGELTLTAAPVTVADATA